jgi:hypothetical protein
MAAVYTAPDAGAFAYRRVAIRPRGEITAVLILTMNFNCRNR